MKQKLFYLILTLLSFLGIAGAQDTIKIDTVQLTMLWSQCSFCNPQTDIGFATFRNKGTPEKPNAELIQYLDRDLQPLKSQAIVWMINIPKRNK